MAKALSTYVDSLFNYVMREAFLEHFPMNQPGLSTYADFFALSITVLFASKFMQLKNYPNIINRPPFNV